MWQLSAWSHNVFLTDRIYGEEIVNMIQVFFLVFSNMGRKWYTEDSNMVVKVLGINKIPHATPYLRQRLHTKTGKSMLQLYTKTGKSMLQLYTKTGKSMMQLYTKTRKSMMQLYTKTRKSMMQLRLLFIPSRILTKCKKISWVKCSRLSMIIKGKMTVFQYVVKEWWGVEPCDRGRSKKLIQPVY